MKKRLMIFVLFGIFLIINLFGFVSSYQINRTGEVFNLTHERNFSHLTVSDPNLILYLPFDVQEDQFNKTYDYINNSNDGIVRGDLSWNFTGGYYGGAYEFDGVDDYVDVGYIKSISETTITFWFRAGSGNHYREGLFDFATALGRKGGFNINVSSSNFRPLLYLSTDNSCYFSSDFNNYLDGEWHFFTLYIAGSENSSIEDSLLYVDATPIGVVFTASAGAPTAWNDLRIGMSDDYGGYFNGSIDEFMILNKNLTVAEIQQLYNSTYSRFYPTGEMLFENLNLSLQGDTNISFENCQTYNWSYIQGKINNRNWVNFTDCQFNDSGFSDLDNFDFTVRLVSNNDFYSPTIIGPKNNPINWSNSSSLFATELSLTFPPTNSSPYYDYNDSYYGAGSNPTGNPIGGFTNYSRIIDSDDANYYVSTKEGFLEVVDLIVPGEIIYINDSAILEFDETINIYVNNITIASGRGRNYSQGALLKWEDWIKFKETPGSAFSYTLFNVSASNIRLTGLRIYGADEDSHWEVLSAFNYQNRDELDSVSTVEILSNTCGFGVNFPYFEIDNSEIYGWRYGGVCLGTGARNSYVHHNYLHDNWRIGLGYGVVVAEEDASALIESNLFNRNRHSISSYYVLNSYEARYNVDLGERGYHVFDRHGNGTLGGNYTIIHHNNFYQVGSPAMNFISMGASTFEEGGQVYNNWFQRDSIISSIFTRYPNLSVSDYPGAEGTNTSVFSNLANASGNPYYSEPVAVATVDDYNVSINQEITFNGSGSYSNESSIRYIEWDFADNSSLIYGNTATHSFSEAGRYLVKLTVSDEVGFLNWTYLNITVNPENNSKTYLDFWIFEESYVDSPEYVVKRVRVNGEIVLEQNFSDNVSAWQHISVDVPSNLTIGDSVNLTLGVEVLQNYTDPLYPNVHEVEFFDIYFDQISILRCGEDLVGSYEGDFEYANDTLYSDMIRTDWTNKTSYERRISGTYAYKISPVWRGNYTEGESYGLNLNNIALNEDCYPVIAQSTEETTTPSSGSGTFRPSRSSLEKGYSVNVMKNSKVEIPVGDSSDKKTIEIKDVDADSDKVIVSVDGEDYEISLNESSKIDLDDDGYYDLEITNKKITGTYANLEFKLIHEEVPAEEEEEQESSVKGFFEEKVKNWIYWVVGIVVLVLGWLWMRKRR